MDQLSEDCMAARKAGLSYGRYMATKYNPNKPKPEPKPKPKPDPRIEDGGRECIICGAKFYSWVHNKLCCSDQCSKEYNRLKTNERNRMIYAARKKNGI